MDTEKMPRVSDGDFGNMFQINELRREVEKPPICQKRHSFCWESGNRNIAGWKIDENRRVVKIRISLLKGLEYEGFPLLYEGGPLLYVSVPTGARK